MVDELPQLEEDSSNQVDRQVDHQLDHQIDNPVELGKPNDPSDSIKSAKTVKIAAMEINLTAIWETLTGPFVWLFYKLTGLKRSRSRRRLNRDEKSLQKIKLARLAAILGLGGVILGVFLFFGLFAWYSRDLPQPGQVVRREGFSTRIFDRNGELLYDLFNEERRIPITIDQAPEHLLQATIAIEDKDFYKHQGFDFLTVFRIPYNIVFRRRVVGGSTLTQQLVKNVLLSNERTISRKFKEFVLALQIERKFSKDQILEMYLNEAPYGGTAWGVGTAADLYFDKKIEELNVVESAFLSGLPQRPSAYSPFAGKTDEDGTPLWRVRATGVLLRMREDGYLTDISFEEALFDLENLEFSKTDTQIKAPHFVFYVRDKLAEVFGEDVVDRGGLQVTTTLDLELQDEAQGIVAEEVEKVSDFNITNGAAMVMDPQTGEIISMVGSVDYFSEEIDGQFNVAVDGLRQPGSSIKPVTYLTLLQQGHTPASVLMDVETLFTPHDTAENPYQPKNYDGEFRGPVTVRSALGSSLNVIAVKSLAIVGIESFLQNAFTMGFPTLEPSEENFKRFGLALTLGGGEVHLIDTTTAYSSFANGGKKVEPVAILKVEDQDGNVLFENRPIDGRQIFSAAEAFLINDILSDNSARLLAFGPNSLLNTGLPIAVKTGTTNDQRDNWTIGWSQEVMVGAWVGNNDNSPMRSVASGITGASPIWRKIIFAAIDKGYGTPEWQIPSGIDQVEADVISGYPNHDGYPVRNEYVIRGTQPSLPDPIHTKLKVCRGDNGRLATDAKIAAGDYDEKEFIVLQESDPVSTDGKNRWQEAIDAWINGQGDDRYKVPTEFCGESADVFVRLNRPENEKSYDSEEIEINMNADSGEGIEKMELYVDGSLRETVNDRTYNSTIHLSAGRHELYVKAFSRGGKEAQTGKIKIGTGGVDWKEPDPSPTPSPSPSPSLSPSPSP